MTFVSDDKIELFDWHLRIITYFSWWRYIFQSIETGWFFQRGIKLILTRQH